MAYYSNSSEGGILDEQCSSCKYGQEQCPIALAQIVYNYDQCGDKTGVSTKILNTIVDQQKGCMMFVTFNKDLNIELGLLFPELYPKIPNSEP